MLPKIIHEDQKGFMKGRHIGENIRLLYDVLQYAETKELPGLLLIVDFEERSTVSRGLLLKKLSTSLTLVQTLNSGLRPTQMQALVF